MFYPFFIHLQEDFRLFRRRTLILILCDSWEENLILAIDNSSNIFVCLREATLHDWPSFFRIFHRDSVLSQWHSFYVEEMYESLNNLRATRSVMPFVDLVQGLITLPWELLTYHGRFFMTRKLHIFTIWLMLSNKICIRYSNIKTSNLSWRSWSLYRCDSPLFPPKICYK